MSDTAFKRLASVIDGYFNSSFLFDVYHTSWRQRASPAEGTAEFLALAKSVDGTVVPPVVRFASITAYDDVHSAAKATRENDDGSKMSEEELAAAVKEAVTKFAKLVVFVEDPALGNCLRRVSMLSEDENPIQRTVHMKPIHQNATEAEIRSFVVNHFIRTLLVGKEPEQVDKLITLVSRRSIVDVSATGISRKVFYAQVEFVKKELALNFVKSKPNYTAPDALLQHYLPPLKVKMLVDHMTEFEEIEARREAERNRQQMFRAAQQQELDAETKRIVAGEAEEGATIQVAGQFLTPGKTLKIPSLPANVSWKDVKVKLSNLFPEEKRLIRLVKEHEGGAYVVLFSPEKLEPLLTAWAADTFSHNVVPSLVKVEGEEEQWAIKEYPSWVGSFVTKKVVKNAKFFGKRQRE